MPPSTVDLDPLLLTHHEGRVRLSVTSRAEFKFPPGVPLQHLNVADALTSGALWVAHARTCRINIRISLDDTPLDSKSGAGILEVLGNHIVGANLWSQLSLSPSLKVSQSDDLASTESELSILLNQSSSSTAVAYPRGWILKNINVKPPPSVPTFQFCDLHIGLDFHTIQSKALHAPKRVKLCEETESMLLDRLEDIDKSHFQVFDEALDRLTHNVRSWVADFVEQENYQSLGHVIPCISQNPASPSKITNDTKLVALFSSTRCNGEAKSSSRRNIFSDDTRSKLHGWLQSNLKNLYPNNETKLQLIKETGLSRNQLNKWLSRARGRLPQPLDEQENDPILLEDVERDHEHSNVIVPLQQAHAIPASFHSFGNFHATDRNTLSPDKSDLDPSDDMLSFLGDEQPAWTTPASTATSITSTSFFSSNKRAAPSSTPGLETPQLALSSSYMLTSAAMNILIGGSACKRSLSGISLQQGFPQAPLSSLVPSLFCPGFKPIMAHNSRFLPTISQAISSSWVRNCQGPGLRRKLLELANLPPPGEDFGEAFPSGEAGSAERLRAVVQRRMWSMIQNKLSDPAAVGKLKWEKTSLEGIARLDNLGDRDDGFHVSRHSGLIEEEYEDDADELLFDNASEDEGILSYFDQTEELEVEKQTDEMLFGGGEYEDEEIELLLDENNEEAMLLYSACPL